MPMARSLSPSVCASEPRASACSVNAGRGTKLQSSFAVGESCMGCHPCYAMLSVFAAVFLGGGACACWGPGSCARWLVNEARSTFTRTRPAAWHILWEENTEDIEI